MVPAADAKTSQVRPVLASVNGVVISLRKVYVASWIREL
jgi:hypothetical protein